MRLRSGCTCCSFFLPFFRLILVGGAASRGLAAIVSSSGAPVHVRRFMPLTNVRSLSLSPSVPRDGDGGASVPSAVTGGIVAGTSRPSSSAFASTASSSA
ncbi:hypothetical protein Vafri_2239, partial [Volvox africanus]